MHKDISMNDTGAIMDITQDGLQKYLDANFKFCEGYVETIVLPDFSLKISGFELAFRQMRVSNAKFPQAQVNYQDHYGQLEIDGITMQLVFEFSL